jgi:hypothetical protein
MVVYGLYLYIIVGYTKLKRHLYVVSWVQVRSLPVSARAMNGTGGVPMASSMRYSAWPERSLVGLASELVDNVE